MTTRQDIRLGADIGGTFTDVVLDVRGTIHSTKVLTNYVAPEQAILDGIATVTAEAGIDASAIDMIIHGTTLATNALIERRGAKTALVTTAGFRDVIEMRTENRFAQYDLNIELPTPLIARDSRLPVAGRLNAQGEEIQPLDEAGLVDIAQAIKAGGYESIAIGFMHSYMNAAHEQRAREILRAHLDIPISISAEVAPQMREFERFNTVCANAYVQPLMAAYLSRMQTRLAEMDVTCPVFMIHSGGGLISVDTATEFPVRLVESGPAGGAIFAADIARRFGIDHVVSYDMGGTTAKVCLIDDSQPQTARTFEVARTYRFCKGSGMPVSIPVIEMIEIGAGGGSIASVDAMNRIQVGPESASSDPGPACYNRGGTRPAITDADLLLGKLDPDNFAGGKITLYKQSSTDAINRDVGAQLNLDAQAAAFGIADMVDENMANAARVHAVENGKNIADNTMIAFGGAAPLHAARLCEKLNIDRCLVPGGAGVGSAIGFLRAPFGYEAVESRVIAMSDFDPAELNALLARLKATAEGFVREGTQAEVQCEITAYMRYAGQGWEIPVALPDRSYSVHDRAVIQRAFEARYTEFFGRTIDGPKIEFVTFSVKAEDVHSETAGSPLDETGQAAAPAIGTRPVFDAARSRKLDTQIIDRTALSPGHTINGPALIVEDETTTVVTSRFNAIVQPDSTLLLLRTGA